MPQPTTGSEGPYRPYLIILLMVILFVKIFKEESLISNIAPGHHHSSLFKAAWMFGAGITGGVASRKN